MGIEGKNSNWVKNLEMKVDDKKFAKESCRTTFQICVTMIQKILQE
jgi:hypothetical protein